VGRDDRLGWRRASRGIGQVTGDLGRDSLRLVLARADFRQILDLRELEEACGRGRGGSKALRAALD